MLGAMGAGLLFERTGIPEYLKMNECLPLVSQILQIIEKTLQGKKAIIIPSDDLDLSAIQADAIWLSIWNESIKLYTRDDIFKNLQWDAIHGLPGNIHMLYRKDGTEKWAKIDIADIDSVITRMKARAMNVSATPKEIVLPEWILHERRQSTASELAVV